jgi:hypothetical protein
VADAINRHEYDRAGELLAGDSDFAKRSGEVVGLVMRLKKAVESPDAPAAPAPARRARTSAPAPARPGKEPAPAAAGGAEDWEEF